MPRILALFALSLSTLAFAAPVPQSAPPLPQSFAGFSQTASSPATINPADAAVLRASQDAVREVVSHEVGHVLGLRHNFAGSLAASLPEKELDNWFREYISGKPLDTYTNKITSASVMDYNNFKASAFIGWRMRTIKEALPHDRAAIA